MCFEIDHTFYTHLLVTYLVDMLYSFQGSALFRHFNRKELYNLSYPSP
jgi:hypothetical protein